MNLTFIGAQPGPESEMTKSRLPSGTLPIRTFRSRSSKALPLPPIGLACICRLSRRSRLT